jgi:transcriptional regulator with XRE-family HTH domain
VTTANDNQPERPGVDFDKAFGARLRRARERAGISQEHLSANLAVMHDVNWHQTTVGKTEAGERPIRLSEAVAVAHLLGVPLNDLAYDPADDTPRVERVALAYAELARVRQDIDAQLTRLRREMTTEISTAGGDA